jgi:acyl-CoA thioesterase-1
LSMKPVLKSIKQCVLVMLFIVISGCGEAQPSLEKLPEKAVILAYGDSLTFGTGSRIQTESYPAVLEVLSGFNVENEGIPGEVSRAGLSRLPEILAEVEPDLVILCHGGNDLIRSLGESQLQDNLTKMVQLIQASGAQVILVAVPRFNITLSIPPLYAEVAEQFMIPIQQTILKEIESTASLKSDTIHPNAQGYKLFAESLHELLQSSGAY